MRGGWERERERGDENDTEIMREKKRRRLTTEGESSAPGGTLDLGVEREGERG